MSNQPILRENFVFNSSALSFWVVGEPVAQGNIRPNRFGNLYDATKGLKPWRKAVTNAATNAMSELNNFESFDEASDLYACFYLPRPKSVKRLWPTSKPDNDKLGRAIGDALTDAKAFKDDSRVIDTFLRKRYVSDLHPNPGAFVVVQKHQVSA